MKRVPFTLTEAEAPRDTGSLACPRHYRAHSPRPLRRMGPDCLQTPSQPPLHQGSRHRRSKSKPAGGPATGPCAWTTLPDRLSRLFFVPTETDPLRLGR